MNIPELFQSVAERVQSAANVRTVYGDPVTAGGKTIIPVARVRYGFGAGGGQVGGAGSEDGDDPEANVGGGGGGMASR